MVSRKVVYPNITLNVTGSSVRLEAVSEQARLLWINWCKVNIPFHIVSIWRWYLLVNLSQKEGSPLWYFWNILLLDLWWEVKILLIERRHVPLSI
jgi:hypothetical protein